MVNETAGAGKKHALTFVFTTNRKIPDIPGSSSPCFPLLPTTIAVSLFYFHLLTSLSSRQGKWGVQGRQLSFPIRWRRGWGAEEMSWGEVMEEFILFHRGEKCMPVP